MQPVSLSSTPEQEDFGPSAEELVTRQTSDDLSPPSSPTSRVMALERELTQLQESSLLKDNILTTLANDLRGPLANMKMAAEILASPRQVSPEQQARYLAVIKAECLRQVNMINDLQDWQALANGSYPLAIESTDLAWILPLWIPDFGAILDVRQQTLVLNLDPDLPRLYIDQSSLHRMMSEMLQMASQFSPPETALTLSVKPDAVPSLQGFQLVDGDPLRPGIRIEIRYQTQGSPRTSQQRITQELTPFQSQRDSTGLRQAIMQKLVERFHGLLSAEAVGDQIHLQLSLPLGSLRLSKV